VIGELNRVIQAQGNQIAQVSQSTGGLMQSVVDDIDGTGSKHSDDVKAAIEDAKRAFDDALSKLDDARSAMYTLSEH
jgi:hypothetical protein